MPSSGRLANDASRVQNAQTFAVGRARDRSAVRPNQSRALATYNHVQSVTDPRQRGMARLRDDSL